MLNFNLKQLNQMTESFPILNHIGVIDGKVTPMPNTAGEIHHVDYLKNIAKLKEKIAELEQVKRERDEAFAQVASLGRVNSKLSQKQSEQGRINALECALTCLQFAVSLSDDESLKKVLSDTLVIYNELEDEGIKPSQCLREIQAEAGRAGFVEGYSSCWFQHYGASAPDFASAFSADQYAAKLRQGGER